MTEAIKFGPEWLRNSVANVSTSTSCTINSTTSVSTETIISRPVLSDHRYGREEMLSLCDKSNRVPEVLTKFRRLYVNDWQMPLALTPNADDERPLGMVSNSWGSSHMRSIIPGVGRGTSGIMRGGSIERGRGRGRGVYHGFNRSTSSYDDESRRTNAWIDRNGNGVDSTSEWGNSKFHFHLRFYA
jgi:PERQ amino acid-rich with GYF domain-containing protein